MCLIKSAGYEWVIDHLLDSRDINMEDDYGYVVVLPAEILLNMSALVKEEERQRPAT